MQKARKNVTANIDSCCSVQKSIKDFFLALLKLHKKFKKLAEGVALRVFKKSVIKPQSLKCYGKNVCIFVFFFVVGFRLFFDTKFFVAQTSNRAFYGSKPLLSLPN